MRFTGKADGTKCKSLIVPGAAKRESKALHQEFKRKLYIEISLNDRMNEVRSWHSAAAMRFWVSFFSVDYFWHVIP